MEFSSFSSATSWWSSNTLCGLKGIWDIEDIAEGKEVLAEEEEEDEEEEEEEDPRDKKGKKEEKSSPKVEKKKEKKEKKKAPSVAQELSDLIHLSACHFGGFGDKAKQGKAWEMSSFSEGKITKFGAKNATDFVTYNSKQLSRIYPKGMRVDSSNYDPVPSWNLGSQIVALNYQTGSEPMWMNVGKFQDNGGAGYILKPQYMRETKITFNPEATIKASKHCEISVISAFELPKVSGKEKGDVIDPYVKLVISGVSLDKHTFKTKVIKNNGFNPIWKTDFKFAVHNMDLALVTFIVSDADLISSDDLIAQYSLPLNCLREGYRFVPLKEKHGKTLEKASLLIYVKYS